jgi:hypothetical protein
VDAFEAQDGEELDGDEAKELTAALRALESTYRTTHVVDPSRFQATAVLYHASVPTVGFPR